MPTLAEILAEKLGRPPIQVPTKVSPKPVTPDLEEDIFMLVEKDSSELNMGDFAHVGQSKYPLPSKETFIAAWSVYLKNPYNYNALRFREYLKWILRPSYYVLGTFRRLDVDSIFDIYMKHMPPHSYTQLHAFNTFLWDLDLFVPDLYQQEFEQIILQEAERKQKIA